MSNARVLSQSSVLSVAGFKNRIINGDMRIDQRFTGAVQTIATSTTMYVLDRWLATNVRGGTVQSIQVAKDTSTNPAGYQANFTVIIGTGQAVNATDFVSLIQFVEGLNVADLQWGTAAAKAVTLSFQCLYSVAGTYSVSIRNADGSRCYVVPFIIPVGNVWTPITVNIAGCPDGNWYTDTRIGLSVTFDLGVGTTYSTPTASTWLSSGNYLGYTNGAKLSTTTGAYFRVTGVQLEVGTLATSFERRNYGLELSMCQRYYQKHNGLLSQGYTAANNGFFSDFMLPVAMRVAPTGTLSNFSNVNAGNAAQNASYTTHWRSGTNMITTGAGYSSFDLDLNAEM